MTAFLSGAIFASTYVAVLKSTDGGASWIKQGSPGSLGINRVYVSASGALYAATDTALNTASGVIAYAAGSSSWLAMAGAPIDVTALTEDAAGSLVAGTGTTGNFNPNPINFGAGVYLYDGSAWSAINNGMPTLPGYSQFPYIKGFAKDASGKILAATYGAGVLRFDGTTWTTFGTGLSNLNVNALGVNPTSGRLFAALDQGVARNTGGTWTTSSSGLPAKPVRSLAFDGNGNVYAGLGFHAWMDGDLVGEIYKSIDGGATWQPASSGFNSSDVLSLAADKSGYLIAGAAGLWRSTDAGTTWKQVAASAVGASSVFAVAVNSKGHIFALSDNQPKYLGYGGVFRSIDGGASWSQVLNGLQRHRGNFLFADSHDNLWVGMTTFGQAASNASNIDGALFKSTDEGDTWTQSQTILVPTTNFTQMAESPTGKLYLASGFGSPTNVSVSYDYETWSNSLNGGAGNGGKAFGVATNAAGDVFLGTETEGVMRALNDGAAPFVNVSPIGGNTNVAVDLNSGTAVATIGTGTQWISASAPVDNGTNWSAFNNLPAYLFMGAAVFDNRGNLYLSGKSGNAVDSGLYVASLPLGADSTFAKIFSNPSHTVSYYFTSMIIDHCGYIYGAQSGVSISASPVNTPSVARLLSPANGAAGVSVSPTFAWSHECNTTTDRLQVARDASFVAPIADISGIASGSSGLQSALMVNATYYWRVQTTNAVGTGSWSAPASFTTDDGIFKNGFEP